MGRVCPEHLQDCQGQGPNLTGWRWVPGAVLRLCRCSGQGGSQGSLVGRGGHGQKALAGWGTSGDVLQTLRAPVPLLACDKALGRLRTRAPHCRHSHCCCGAHSCTRNAALSQPQDSTQPSGTLRKEGCQGRGEAAVLPTPTGGPKVQPESPQPSDSLGHSAVLPRAFCELEEKDAQDSASGSLRLVG